MSRCSKELAALREFFKRNPEEELSFDDVAVKLDIPLRRVYRIAQSLKDDGLCETAHIIRVAKTAAG